MIPKLLSTTVRYSTNMAEGKEVLVWKNKYKENLK